MTWVKNLSLLLQVTWLSPWYLPLGCAAREAGMVRAAPASGRLRDSSPEAAALRPPSSTMVTTCQVRTHEVTWHDMTWHDMTWHDMTWHEVTSSHAFITERSSGEKPYVLPVSGHLRQQFEVGAIARWDFEKPSVRLMNHTFRDITAMRATLCSDFLDKTFTGLLDFLFLYLNIDIELTSPSPC